MNGWLVAIKVIAAILVVRAAHFAVHARSIDAWWGWIIVLGVAAAVVAIRFQPSEWDRRREKR